MSIRTIIAILFAVGLSALSVYVYTLFDPRLDIILLKNEEIMQLDNKIAELTNKNTSCTEQVESIATVVKSNDSDSGKINDEYKICLRTTDRFKKKNRRLSAELKVLKSKNAILQEYVQVKNEVTSLKEQIANLNQEKKDLTIQLGPNLNKNLDVEGSVDPHNNIENESSLIDTDSN